MVILSNKARPDELSLVGDARWVSEICLSNKLGRGSGALIEGLVGDRSEQQRTRKKRAGNDRRYENGARIFRAADLGRKLKGGSTER